MNVTFLALGTVFMALTAVFFAQAKKATDGKAERNARLAGILFAVAGVAFVVAGTLHLLLGTGT